jgi:hypothetical protein
MKDMRYGLSQDTFLHPGGQHDRLRSMLICGGALCDLWKRDSSHVGTRSA